MSHDDGNLEGKTANKGAEDKNDKCGRWKGKIQRTRRVGGMVGLRKASQKSQLTGGLVNRLWIEGLKEV